MSNRHDEKRPRRPLREHLPFEEPHFGDIETNPAAELAADRASFKESEQGAISE